MKVFKKESTIKELYDDAMKIIDKKEADEYFESLVQYGMLYDQTREEANNIKKQNLGYYVGYYDEEVQCRVNKLFKTSHPVFRSKHPTVEEALVAGIEIGKKLGG